MVINCDDYKNDGWGLSKICFENINTIIQTFNNSNVNVIEFGSGISTKFFVDLIEIGHNINIISFDDSVEYSAKVKHQNLKLCIVDLIECFDSDFENQFNAKEYKRNLYFKKFTEVDTKQKNTFYDVDIEQLPKVIDLMVLDGPHGNGRSIAFLLGINRLKSGSYVVIDDYNHYDFVNKFKQLYPNSELVNISTTGQNNKWELGGDFVIYKIN